MRTYLLIALLLAAALIPVASAQKFYVWTDEDGVEHLSSRPPAAGTVDESEVSVVTPDLRNLAPSDASPPSPKAEASATKPQEVAASSEEGNEGAGEAASGPNPPAAEEENTPANRAQRLQQWREQRQSAVRKRFGTQTETAPPGKRDKETAPTRAVPKAPPEPEEEDSGYGYKAYGENWQL